MQPSSTPKKLKGENSKGNLETKEWKRTRQGGSPKLTYSTSTQMPYEIFDKVWEEEAILDDGRKEVPKNGDSKRL